MRYTCIRAGTLDGTNMVTPTLYNHRLASWNGALAGVHTLWLFRWLACRRACAQPSSCVGMPCSRTWPAGIPRRGRSCWALIPGTCSWTRSPQPSALHHSHIHANMRLPRTAPAFTARYSVMVTARCRPGVAARCPAVRVEEMDMRIHCVERRDLALRPGVALLLLGASPAGACSDMHTIEHPVSPQLPAGPLQAAQPRKLMTPCSAS